MITLGVDLAASPKRTASCKVKWEIGRALALEHASGEEDDALLRHISEVDYVGIDVPLGWPDEFVEAVVAHKNHAPWPGKEISRLCLRETDRFVKAKTGLRPLSVSADRIAVPAMRAAKLLSRLAKRGVSVDRRGVDKLVEVYPAAALKVWGFRHSRYKGRKWYENRQALFAAIESQTGKWLHIQDDVREACKANDDVLDALIAALVARGASRSLCESIPEGTEQRAGQEGWIALPRPGTLDKLP